MITIICAIAVITAVITTLISVRRIKLLEKYVTQLELDVQMLIQNSNNSDDK
jgi:hypothetical protein